MTVVQQADQVAAARAALQQRSIWYHTLELAPGILTPGQIDLREVAAKVLPEDLTGRRALDVGTFDGFWAFELERRGAEVVAIDVERPQDAQWPPNNRTHLEYEVQRLQVTLGDGFSLAAEIRGSQARRVICDVLDLTPEAVGGQVDIAFMGALLIHLRDPVAGLERVRNALVPGGSLFQLETVSPWLSLLHPRRPVAGLQTLSTPFNWWRPNLATIKAWLHTAGFTDVRRGGLHHPPQRPPMNDWFCAMSSRRGS